ncbi:MAG: fasciclin domain-containing protein [Actinomycetes bacterium]
MRTRRFIAAIGISTFLVAGVAACSSDSDSNADKPTTTTEAKKDEKCDGTVVDVAVGNADFSTLVTAVQEAGLVDTLNGEGPFTVFAPTNEAFAKIPAADLEAILADKAKLTSILTYHVVPGKVMAADLKPGEQAVTTVEGSEAAVIVSDAGVTYAGANVVATDVDACNGVIHVIDAVVIPPAKN